MKLSEFLHAQGIKAGRTQEDGELKELISKLASMDVDMPEGLAKDLSEKLISLKHAKNFKDVKDHYFAQFANATEKELQESAATLGLSDEEIQAFMAEETPFKKLKKRDELLSQKLTAKGSDENSSAKKHLETIAELNRKLAEKDRLHQENLTKEKESFLTQLKTRDINADIDSIEWADSYKEDRHLLGSARLQEKLAALKGTLVFQDGKWVPKSAETPDLDLYNPVTGQPYPSVKSILDEIVSEKKYLKVAQTPEQKTVVGGQSNASGGANGGASTRSQNANPFQSRAEQILAEERGG